MVHDLRQAGTQSISSPELRILHEDSQQDRRREAPWLFDQLVAQNLKPFGLAVERRTSAFARSDGPAPVFRLEKAPP